MIQCVAGFGERCGLLDTPSGPGFFFDKFLDLLLDFQFVDRFDDLLRLVHVSLSEALIVLVGEFAHLVIKVQLPNVFQRIELPLVQVIQPRETDLRQLFENCPAERQIESPPNRDS